MKSISIAKALTLKNTLVSELADLKNKIVSAKLYEEGRMTPRHEKAKNDLYPEYIRKKANLIELKAAIRVGNIPITKQLVELEETKDHIELVKSMIAEESWDSVGYDNPKEKHVIPTHDQTQVEINLKQLQTRIETLQDEITAFNHSTNINVSF